MSMFLQGVVSIFKFTWHHTQKTNKDIITAMRTLYLIEIIKCYVKHSWSHAIESESNEFGNQRTDTLHVYVTTNTCPFISLMLWTRNVWKIRNDFLSMFI
jgi:hypothetical protein